MGIEAEQYGPLCITRKLNHVEFLACFKTRAIHLRAPLKFEDDLGLAGRETELSRVKPGRTQPLLQ